MHSNKTRDILVASLTLFAMFLGAGNLIFPPYVGAQAGQGWLIACLGFLMTGVGLPLLGTLTIAKLDGDPNRLFENGWMWMGRALNMLILLAIGPLFAIPRTAATTCELSVLPFLSDSVNQQTVFIMVCSLFFIITYLLSVSESKVMDAIGGILAPVLVVFLIITIILSIVRPIGKPQASVVEGSIFYYGFSSGYQTMDGIGSLVMSGAIAALVAQRGYQKKEAKGILRICAVVAGLLLAMVYGGYTWIGASGSGALRGFTERTAMLSHASMLIGGHIGKIMLAAIIFFACITTASGLTVTFAQYFCRLFKNKLSYKVWVLICVGFSFFISLIGVEGIIKLSVPVLEIIYPLCIVVILLHQAERFIFSRSGFKGAVVASLLYCLILALGHFSATQSINEAILDFLPLGKDGFGYLLPSAMGFAIGSTLERFNKQQGQEQSPSSQTKGEGKALV